jgi:tetratricopeptide (TPR) repeat protein
VLGVLLRSAPGSAAPKPTEHAPSPSSAPRPPRTSETVFARELEQGLAQHRAGQFVEARDSFLRALAALPDESGRANLEFNIAACDYELGHFDEAQRRFERAATLDVATRAEALLQAGWAALGAGDERAVERHLGATSGEAGIEQKRNDLAEALDTRRRERAAAELDQAIDAASVAYQAGQLEQAQTALGLARARAAGGSARSRGTLYYLSALVARERGDAAAARVDLKRSLSENPNDGAVHAMLGELAQEGGDGASAERHYRASLAADLSASEASAVRDALDALYPVPARGLDVWAALGAGYDSNATQSGSSDAVGYAGPEQSGSAFAVPAWGVEYRRALGARARIGPYYTGEWLALVSTPVEDASLQSHEAGLRFYFAPTPAADLTLAAGGGLTLSGLELAPFSLEGLLRARFALRHGRHLRSLLLAEVRPSRGLSGQDYLTGARSDVSLGERLQSGRWGVSASAGFRYNGIGTQLVDIDPAQFPRCNVACVGARYEIPLGYSGPFVGAGADVAVGAFTLGLSGKYEHRTYLAQSRIDGPALPVLIAELSEKTRVDDRYTLAARARYQLGTEPAIGLFTDYTLRLSRSNIAFRRDLEHAFDYDDRNFTQHVIELGVDFRL